MAGLFPQSLRSRCGSGSIDLLTKAKGSQCLLSSTTPSVFGGSGSCGTQASQEARGLGRLSRGHGAARLLPLTRDARVSLQGKAGLCLLLLPERVLICSGCSCMGFTLVQCLASHRFDAVPVTNYSSDAHRLPVPSECQLFAVHQKQRRFASVTIIFAMLLGVRGLVLFLQCWCSGRVVGFFCFNLKSHKKKG